MKIIRKIGNAQRKSYHYSDIRLERDGFLSTYSAEVDGQRYRQELVFRGNAVVVLPVDVKRREIYLIRQPRFNKAYAVDRNARIALEQARSGSKRRAGFTVSAEEILTLEAPAGMVEPGETPVQAAIRELREETGFTVEDKDLKRVAGVFPSIGTCTEYIDCFLALLPDQPQSAAADGDGSEEIELVSMSWDEAFDLLDQDKFQNGMSNIVMRELRIRHYQDLCKRHTTADFDRWIGIG